MITPAGESLERSRVEHLMTYPNAIFVFGSNAQGIHGKGAALTAKRRYGAADRLGEGLSRQSYALPTKWEPHKRMILEEVRLGVTRFKLFARLAPGMMFVVTRVGCGNAGFDDTDIAPLFKGATANVRLPIGWREINGEPSDV